MSTSQKVQELLQKTYDNFLKVGAYYAGRGDLEMVREILKQKPQWLQERGSHGRTMLWTAVYHNQREMAEFLLHKGADIHNPGCHFSEHLVEISPYCLAIIKKYKPLAEILFEKGAKYDIYTAAYLGDYQGFKELYQQDPSIIHRPWEASLMEETASLMHYALAGENTAIVRFLCEKGVALEPYSHWLLKFALWKENWEHIELLVAHGADPKALIIREVLPLEIRKRLQDCGIEIDLDKPDKRGWPVLVYTCRGDNGEHPEEVIQLLEAGADIHATNLKGRTALHTAAKAGFAQVSQVLLEAGAEVNATDQLGETPIYAALRSTIKRKENLKEVIRLLLSAGANLSHQNHKGVTPLMVLHAKKDKEVYLELF